MKLDVRNTSNNITGTVELPKQFNEPVREDLIKRAVQSLQSAKRQRYGANPKAGTRSSAFVSKRRHKFRSTYGIGQSRTPRKVMSVRGSRFNWVGAFAPQTVGGRRSHPAKALKEWFQKINKKERQKAINSAMAASINVTSIEERGHKLPAEFPFIIDNDFEKLTKTKEVIAALQALGLGEELSRAEVRKVRAGKGKMRGRKTKTRTSTLLVTATESPLKMAAPNILGVDVVGVNELNAEHLAPGSVAGRLTLYTKNAIEALQNPTSRTSVKEKKVEAPKKKAKTTIKPKAESKATPKKDSGVKQTTEPGAQNAAKEVKVE